MRMNIKKLRKMSQRVLQERERRAMPNLDVSALDAYTRYLIQLMGNDAEAQDYAKELRKIVKKMSHINQKWFKGSVQHRSLYLALIEQILLSLNARSKLKGVKSFKIMPYLNQVYSSPLTYTALVELLQPQLIGSQLVIFDENGRPYGENSLLHLYTLWQSFWNDCQYDLNVDYLDEDVYEQINDIFADSNELIASFRGWMTVYFISVAPMIPSAFHRQNQGNISLPAAEDISDAIENLLNACKELEAKLTANIQQVFSRKDNRYILEQANIDALYAATRKLFHAYDQTDSFVKQMQPVTSGDEEEGAEVNATEDERENNSNLLDDSISSSQHTFELSQATSGLLSHPVKRKAAMEANSVADTDANPCSQKRANR